MKKIILFALIISVSFSFRTVARAENIFSALSRLLASSNSGQLAQVVSSGAPIGLTAMTEKARLEAQTMLGIATSKLKPQIGSPAGLSAFKLANGVQASVAPSPTVVCPTGQVRVNITGNDGATIVCRSNSWTPSDFLQVHNDPLSGDQVLVGSKSRTAGVTALSVTGTPGRPFGIWGFGDFASYSTGVTGFSGGMGGTGVYGFGNQNGTGVEGDSAGWAGVAGNHYLNSESLNNYGYGVYGGNNAGPGVAGFGWDRTQPDGSVIGNVGVYGNSQSSIGVQGSGNWGGLFSGSYVGLAVGAPPAGGYGIYQFSPGRNHFDGPIDSNGDICTSLNGGKCLSTVGGGTSQWATDVSGTNIHNTNTGNVGIGTNNPLAKLQVVPQSGPSIVLPDQTNPRYSVGLGSTQVVGVGQRLDFYTGDSGSNNANLDSSKIRMSINAVGNVTINSLTGTGNAYACINASGQLYRSSSPCS